MKETIFDGLVLMMVGMGTVFVFLTFLIVVVKTLSSIINKYWPETVALPEVDNTVSDEPQLVAAITAAVAQYRRKHARNNLSK